MERNDLFCSVTLKCPTLAWAWDHSLVPLHWGEQEMLLSQTRVSSSPHPPCPTAASWPQLWKSHRCVCPTLPGEFLECTESPSNGFRFVLCFEFSCAVICTLSSAEGTAGTGPQLLHSRAEGYHHLAWAEPTLSCPASPWPELRAMTFSIWTPGTSRDCNCKNGFESSLDRDGNASLKMILTCATETCSVHNRLYSSSPYQHLFRFLAGSVGVLNACESNANSGLTQSWRTAIIYLL